MKKKIVNFNGRSISLQKSNAHHVVSSGADKSKSRGGTGSIEEEEVVAVIGGLKVVKTGTSKSKSRGGKPKSGKPKNALRIPVYYKENSEKPYLPSGELFITFKGKVKKSEQEIFLKENRLKEVKTYSKTKMVVSVRKGTDAVNVAIKLQDSDLIKSIDVDLDTEPEHYELIPSDDLFLSPMAYQK